MMLSEEDYEKYSAQLNDYDMTDEQKREMIDQLCLVVTSFVDLAFDQSPVQLAVNEKNRALAETIREFVDG
ncbi:MAG: hypothetical protein ACE37E_00510 [Hyphomicrobiales bacterium]